MAPTNFAPDPRSFRSRRRRYSHLNGTSRDALVEQRLDVYTAAKALLEAMAQARPHGRDHYPPNSQPLAEAQAIQTAREAAVQAIMDAVQAEAILLQK